MARYDRIAPLPPPDRADAFPAWLVLRDLEGRERDAELGRRTRLRFLALRPVTRLARRGIENVSADSYERQIEGVREELGHLSARDPERARLAKFLHEIRQRTPLAVTTAALDLGEVVEAATHYHGAEEIYQTALELAGAYGLAPEQALALRLLGRTFRKRGRREEARQCYRRSGELALRYGDRRQWCHALEGIARTLGDERRHDEERAVYEEMLARARGWEDRAVAGRALAGLCRTALATGDEERALEHGRDALGRLQEAEEASAVLALLGTALSRLGLYAAAERCHRLAAARAVRPRTQARAVLGLAEVEAALGRTDTARERLRTAINIAQEQGVAEVLEEADRLLSVLEAAAAGAAPPTPARRAVSPAARRIAAELQAFDEALVPASG